LQLGNQIFQYVLIEVVQEWETSTWLLAAIFDACFFSALSNLLLVWLHDKSYAIHCQ
jgi:hypothetical protein